MYNRSSGFPIVIKVISKESGNQIIMAGEGRKKGERKKRDRPNNREFSTFKRFSRLEALLSRSQGALFYIAQRICKTDSV